MSITIYPSQFNMREDGGYEQLPAIKGETGEQGAPGVGALPGGAAGQIPVKQSGTDYDVAWEDIGWKLLWENASTSSTFSAQTVPLDLSGAKEVMMSVGWQNDGYAQIDYHCRVGDHVALVIFAAVTTSSGAVEAYKRETVVSSSGIEFKDCISKKTNATNAGTTYNGGCIPYRIYAR